jgi:DNA-binding Lrp family transcriptional regulator
LEKELVRHLDQQIPLTERPFLQISERIGISEEKLLSILRRWKEQGALRRIGAILYHRRAGFIANAMCVWPVSEEILSAGTCVAGHPEVTHCYQRPRLEAFPFDLYAMIHTGNRSETEALFDRISETCGLSGGELFVSGREFKKSSMKYFR